MDRDNRLPICPTPLRELFESLDRRRRPEDVAQLVLAVLGDGLDPSEKSTLQRASRHALRQPTGYFGFTSMSEDFARPVGMTRQLAVAETLFPASPIPDEAEHDQPAAVRTYLADVEPTIGKAVGRNDFKHDRLNRPMRRAAGLDLSRRQYNKRFRLMARMEAKLDRLEREWRKRGFTLIGKSRLASRLTWEEFSSDRVSACFIAYYAARCNLRSEFTIDGQQRPYDQIANMLFQRCRQTASVNWWAIAHVFPDREVLRFLSEEQRGRLLGEWFGILEQVSSFLREVWEGNKFERTTMIVRRGNDSSTWNVTAGAWNKARESWFALLHALDADEVIEAMCPGKVLRLMAADVAAWHRATGGGLEPDTAVWNALPLPWEVLTGQVECTKRHVEEVCRRHAVDPVKTGWTAARSSPRVEAFRPTPELVHGVTVGHPGLALMLRRMGVFSGKHLKLPPVDKHP